MVQTRDILIWPTESVQELLDARSPLTVFIDDHFSISISSLAEVVGEAEAAEAGTMMKTIRSRP